MSEIVGVHPYADKFPMLTDAELDELAESIATIGLINPIVVDTAGLILDGRNRLEACNRSGVETVTTVYEGGDVAEFIKDGEYFGEANVELTTLAGRCPPSTMPY